ncbi:MarR family transcriptional regulator [Streptosporangiaceae bacterium NEAU-GS5]|nr:MarR family transcriptional regulator [Streptosporangiaceae bacterium NEAU-GS5]
MSARSPADHAPLGYALALAAFAHRGRMQRLLAAHGLHLGQERVVFELAQTPGITQSALAARLGVEQPTVAKAMARMARQGLVTIGRDERDARATRLSLTERGMELLGVVVACWQTIETQMSQGLSPAERDQLRALLGTCTANLTESEGTR